MEKQQRKAVDETQVKIERLKGAPVISTEVDVKLDARMTHKHVVLHDAEQLKYEGGRKTYPRSQLGNVNLLRFEFFE